MSMEQKQDEERDAGAQNEYRPSQRLWSMIVIKAEDKVFRVYSDLLSRQSSIFRDMLAMPQSDQVEKIDGHPYVEVQDSASDMEMFLNALCIPNYYDEAITLWRSPFKKVPEPSHDDGRQGVRDWETEHVSYPAFLSAVVRLSIKYDVPVLRRRAVRHLTSIWPTELEGWKLEHTDSRRETGSYIFKIARECDLRALLPSALYIHCDINDNADLPSPISEDPADITRCAFGRQRIMGRWRRLVYETISEECSSYSRTSCKQARLAWLTGNSLPRLLFDGSEAWHDYLSVPTGEWLRDVGQLCSDCQAALRQRVDQTKKRVWSDLPVFFHLPSWNVLLEEFNAHVQG
ncbi:hypothetical protein GLOTRDRAFT_131142 [Gloeophyllum trabeum ATCC 11539]|uniref:BTB domain-containing protein n=1 Tax=Gloeophyllum trabeum (strain ATCC 11539 / FP-39264 / Madison 617) TaxID=670483 RepID=S7Q1G7_GLOTA|nr:uncharacterized protein GLOTRDRAFT_131142 [Gloeophyllum trabeum ATCC 11539]EPQ53811.1 hypothetical protein GLOTRDRAFT_131142 [Gloeophyllum trabeum ATCC 11539]